MLDNSDPRSELIVRLADQRDIPALAAMNAHLIEDQGAQAKLDHAGLVARMTGWLASVYQAAVGEINGEPVGYVLWRPEDDGVFLRHLFVSRDHRRERVGQRLFAEVDERFFRGAEITLTVLVDYPRAAAFWGSLGFSAYATALKRSAAAPQPGS